MHNHLVPVLVLIVLPALYLGYRLRLAETPAIRWVGGGLLLAAVAAAIPYEGIDFLYLKYMKLFLCAALALLFLTLHHRLEVFVRWWRTILIVALVAAGGVYYNFFSFHGGERVFIHLHDVAHYYLGSKYYAEVGYDQLYTAMLRAEAEVYDDHFKSLQARDLTSYDEVHVRTLLLKSEQVKERFEASRWSEFQRDVAYFRDRLDSQYAKVLLDHGFNPTPVWAMLAGALSRRVAGGSHRGILLLTLLDLGLVAGLFAAVRWAFGRTAFLLAVLQYFLIFGAGFGWTGGGFLRYLWLFGVVAGIACLKRRRHAAAGALLALATMVRVFPVFFVVPLATKALFHVLERRPPPRRLLVFLGSFAATAGALFLLTLVLLPRGLDHWREFREQMELHVAVLSPNTVGLTEILAYRPGEELVAQPELKRLKERRQGIYRAQLVLIFLPALAAVAWASRREGDVEAALLALPLLFLGLTLAGYYYVFLILLALRYRRSPRDLAILFAVEAASYSLLLFEDRDDLLFLYRSVLLFFLYFVLHLPTIGRWLLVVADRTQDEEWLTT